MLLTVFVIAVAMVGTVVFLSVRDKDSSSRHRPTGHQPGRRSRTVTDSTSSTRQQVYFVEFLDFEYEGCRALYPAVEQLRSTATG